MYSPSEYYRAAAACSYVAPLFAQRQKAKRRGGKPPSEVCVPTAFSQLSGAFLFRSIPNRIGDTPSGFLTPSTFCSPDSLLDLFHSSPALGIRPSRFSSLIDAVDSLESHDPHGLVLASFRLPAVPSGLCSPIEARHTLPSYSLNKAETPFLDFSSTSSTLSTLRDLHDVGSQLPKRSSPLTGPARHRAGLPTLHINKALCLSSLRPSLR